MRPRERRESGEQDMFSSRIEEVINMDNKMVKMERKIDWGLMEEKLGEEYEDG